jgi:hypothetical protein
MSIEELLRSESSLQLSPLPENDPLRDSDALQEADLVGIWVDVLRSTTTVLFDLRNAIELRSGNTGLVSFIGAPSVTYHSTDDRREPFVSHLVVGSTVESSAGSLCLTVSLDSWDPHGEEVVVSGGLARFLYGEVPGLSPAPPNFPDDPRNEILSHMPSWRSEFILLHASERQASE